jgi:hypothetical protein
MRPGVLVSVLMTACALLAACGGDSEDPDPAPEPTSSSTTSESPSTPTASDLPSLPVPEGVELTPQGSSLALREPAVVAYRPRQDAVAVLTVAVTHIERTTLRRSFAGWKLDASFAGVTPYFVRARLANSGDTDLGGRPVPLYGVSSAGTLIEASTFRGSFEPCPSLPFPPVFAAGATHRACLVYLAPKGTTVEAVSFQPSEEFDPITWTGPVTRPGPRG